MVVDIKSGAAALLMTTGIYTITGFAGVVVLPGRCDMFTDP